MLFDVFLLFHGDVDEQPMPICGFFVHIFVCFVFIVAYFYAIALLISYTRLVVDFLLRLLFYMLLIFLFCFFYICYIFFIFFSGLPCLSPLSLFVDWSWFDCDQTMFKPSSFDE